MNIASVYINFYSKFLLHQIFQLILAYSTIIDINNNVYLISNDYVFFYRISSYLDM